MSSSSSQSSPEDQRVISARERRSTLLGPEDQLRVKVIEICCSPGGYETCRGIWTPPEILRFWTEELPGLLELAGVAFDPSEFRVRDLRHHKQYKQYKGEVSDYRKIASELRRIQAGRSGTGPAEVREAVVQYESGIRFKYYDVFKKLFTNSSFTSGFDLPHRAVDTSLLRDEQGESEEGEKKEETRNEEDSGGASSPSGSSDDRKRRRHSSAPQLGQSLDYLKAQNAEVRDLLGRVIAVLERGAESDQKINAELLEEERKRTSALLEALSSMTQGKVTQEVEETSSNSSSSSSGKRKTRP